MQAEDLLKVIGGDFYTGVPDSQLKAICNYLMNEYGIDPRHHLIAANEGNCVGLAAGYHMATGKIPVVYLQNSGEGNIINPVASLLNDNVYAIPCVFIIGWRGEPNVHDEPQHIYQGRITLDLLDDLDIEYFVVDRNTEVREIESQMNGWRNALAQGKQVAFVIKKGALSYDKKVDYVNKHGICREEAIKSIAEVAGTDPVVSTTGKASRELFEIREANKQSHGYDFLTVGSMGHASSIALAVAINKPNRKIWCIDGDGAALMHLGAMPVIGSVKPQNLVHVVINNGAHETVGGMPTVADNLDLAALAADSGYAYSVTVDNYADLKKELCEAKRRDGLSFIEIKCAIGSRSDLGRPTTTSIENKENFMEYLKSI